jgi:hypothetical protein
MAKLSCIIALRHAGRRHSAAQLPRQSFMAQRMARVLEDDQDDQGEGSEDVEDGQ